MNVIYVSMYYSVHKVFQVLDPFLSSTCSNTISHKWEGLGEERKTIKPQEVGVSKIKKRFQLVCSFMEFFIFVMPRMFHKLHLKKPNFPASFTCQEKD